MMGISTLAEAYADFGAVGVPLIMFAQGLFLAACVVTLGSQHRIGPEAVLLSLSIYFLNGIGGSAVMLYGAVLQGLVANLAVLWLAAGAWIQPSCFGLVGRRG